MNGTTTNPLSTSAVPPTFPRNERILLGVVLAITGNLLISVSMNIQKYSHNKLIPGTSYIKSLTWWGGIILMAIGEVGNFSAYAFAPASLVAPLGTTTVIANAVIAVVFLKEKIRYRDVLGIVLAIVGAFLLITFSNKNDTMLSAQEILVYIKQWSFLVYMGFEIVAFVVFLFWDKYYEVGKIIVILLQVAILGSFTVITAKAVSSMLTITFRGYSQLNQPIFYIMFAIMVATAVAQVRFLSKAMSLFDTTMVVPTNFVFFTMSAIIGGIVFYREFYGLLFLDIFMFLFGAFLSFGGVYLITAERKKVDVPSSEDENVVLIPCIPTVTTNDLVATSLQLHEVYDNSALLGFDGIEEKSDFVTS
ncbi:NIPA-like protein 2 isoform X4 [Hydra vulgaris]|uniref:NIPA-like protein 2 isoform X4 n=2 Tax=Hydra vulgaris TaxID=6087 RepID=A0ABM4D932_HYDVU